MNLLFKTSHKPAVLLANRFILNFCAPLHGSTSSPRTEKRTSSPRTEKRASLQTEKLKTEHP